MTQSVPSIAPYSFSKHSTLDIAVMESQHQEWSAGQSVEALPVEVGGIGLAERLWSPLAAELKHVPYGMVGSVNSLHHGELSPAALEGIAYRNGFLSSSKRGNIDAIARAFLGLVQDDAQGVKDRILGWDLATRAGNYDQGVRTFSHNVHVDGGPLTIRYVASVIGATTIFGEGPISKPDVDDAGSLHNAAVLLKPTKPNVVYRFGAMTVHAAPPPDDQPRLFLSATAWLEQ